MSLALFDFKGSGVRVIDNGGDPWFVAKDVCRILGLGNPRSSLALLDEDEKGVHTVDTLGGPQRVAAVNESGLYALIFKSRKQQAHSFRKWITSEVIPTIRKTGQYSVQRETPPAVAAWLTGKLLEIMPAEKLLSLLKVRHSYGSIARNGKPRTGWRRPAYVAAPHRLKDAQAFQEGMVQLNLTVQLELPQLAGAIAELEGRRA